MPYGEVAKKLTLSDEKQAEIIPIEKMPEAFFHIPDPDNAGVGTMDKTS